jgi:hypothetical protein
MYNWSSRRNFTNDWYSFNKAIVDMRDIIGLILVLTILSCKAQALQPNVNC